MDNYEILFRVENKETGEWENKNVLELSKNQQMEWLETKAREFLMTTILDLFGYVVLKEAQVAQEMEELGWVLDNPEKMERLYTLEEARVKLLSSEEDI